MQAGLAAGGAGWEGSGVQGQESREGSRVQQGKRRGEWQEQVTIARGQAELRL